MRYISILFISLATVLWFSGCKSKRTMAEANKTFEKKLFYEAAQQYAQVAKNTKNNNERKEAFYKEGVSHLMYNNYAKAEKAFEKAVKGKAGIEAKLKYAETLMLQEKYTEAIIKLNEIIAEDAANKDAECLKEGCTLALKWKNEKTRYIIENFKKVNTRESDYSPFLLEKDGLIFTSNRADGMSSKPYKWTGDYYEDVYIAKISKKKGVTTFENPELLKGDVNTNFNEGTAAFADKGKTIYYTQCNGSDGKGYTCKIYSATKRGKEEFLQSTLLEFSASDSFSCGHPTISTDGQKLYFSSNMPGGYGGFDLYVVNFVKKGKTWSEPLNLGPTINTSRDEMYPYLHEDGTLYFSSNGHCGIGGLDICFTTGAGNEWAKPENMKSPFNSSADDFAPWLAPNKESGYFTSNRAGGRGKDDIYAFSMRPCELFLTGVVRDEKTKQVIPNAQVKIKSNKSNDLILLTTDAAGSYKLPLTKETKYELYASGPEFDYYLDSRTAFASSEGVACFTTLTQDFLLPKVEPVFVVGILYGLDSADIRPTAAVLLQDSVVSVLKKFPRLKIELGSHTDCRATHAYNEGLSQRRADSAVAFIISRGIDSDRVVAKGYGETKLLLKKCACDLSDPDNKICSEAEHQLNRRTEITIIDYNYVPIRLRGGNSQEKSDTPQNAPTPPKPRLPRRGSPPKK